jgi:uncharacterized membrane protein YhaH (DUF805 family)
MIAPFSFSGQIQRLPYALWSLGVFFSQHLAILIIFRVQGARLQSDLEFYLSPLRSLVRHGQVSSLMLVLALAYLLIVAWALAALAFRRAADANMSEWIAAAAIAPVVQLPVIALLCLAPSRASVDRLGASDLPEESSIPWSTAAVGALAGTGLTLAAVATEALVFGSYGYGMFLVSPFVIGAVTGYLGNRTGNIGVSRTSTLVVGAASLGGIALVAVALEGIICILMAAPIGIGAAVIGGQLGRMIALSTRRPPHQTLSAFALLPLTFAVENVMSSTTSFDTTETIAIHAPPEWVWKSIVNMDTIEELPALPFRLGVAYPLRGEIVGEGIGAVRRGEFSTGTAIERVTEWAPNRKLAFVVVTDVPGMRELSPYQHVHAPHVTGYFLTTNTSFELRSLPDGRTEIVERTSHQLKLDPVFYWLPMARWVVHANNIRVLAHISRHAESGFRESGVEPAIRNQPR